MVDYSMEVVKQLFKVSLSNGKVSVWQCWSEGAEVFTTFGTLEGKQQTQSYTAKAKSVGKSNETSPEEQALLEVGTAYVAQRKNKHYRDTIEEAQALADECTIPRKVHNFKDHGHKLTYPLYASIKKNGSRGCVLNGALYSKIGLKEDVKVSRIKNALIALGNPTLDAEVYSHGMSLQRIRKCWLKPVRTEKELVKMRKDYLKKMGKALPYNPNEDADELQLHVFDVPAKGVPFEERLQLMRELDNQVTLMKLDDVIKFIYPVLINSPEEGEALRDEVVADGYEGLVYYQADDMYEFGTRSYTCQKDKPRYDSECLVLGVEECKNGDGKLLVRACDKLDRVEFKVMMKVSRRDGLDYPRKVVDMEKLIGKWITFAYEELSDKGVPTKPTGEEERKCDSTGMPLE